MSRVYDWSPASKGHGPVIAGQASASLETYAARSPARLGIFVKAHGAKLVAAQAGDPSASQLNRAHFDGHTGDIVLSPRPSGRVL